MQVDDDQYDFCYRQATYPLWLKYRINKSEFRLLKQLHWYLKHKNKVITSKEVFFETITNNFREKKNMEGYLNGLLKGGFVGAFEYIKQPGSLSLGLSDLGVNVLKDFKQHYDTIAAKYQPSSYRLDSHYMATITQEPKPYYKAKTA